MIIKLASITNEHEASLTGEAKKEYKAMKAGAVIGGSLAAAKYLTKKENVINPDLGRIRRFVVKYNLDSPRLGDMISKRVFDPGTGLRMGAIGAIGGALAGLGIHKVVHAYKKRKQ
jgi:hypothetical protein